MTQTIRTVAVAPLACLLLIGCRVSEHKHGDNKDLDIQTPFGSTSIKTNDAADPAAIGLTAYPGAQPVHDNDSDSNSADVNMNFGSFHLGVKAAGYETTDSSDKVLAFYRRDLGRYGDVIECRGRSTIGEPTRTSDGLTCDDDNKVHNTSSSSHDKLELKAGSHQHQHAVSIDSRNGGTHFGLVLIDLPTHSDDKRRGPE